MKKILILLTLMLLGSVSLLIAETIPEGKWIQTASTAGECDCSIRISYETERIITIDASNGWKGFASYDVESDMYNGFFELLSNDMYPDASWRNRVFVMELRYDGLTLTLSGSSDEQKFMATYWKE